MRDRRRASWSTTLAAIATIVGCSTTPSTSGDPSPRVDGTTPEPRPTPETGTAFVVDGGKTTENDAGGPPPCALVTVPPAPPAGAPADVTIAIDGASGPHGAAAPVAVDRKLYGMNVADWMPQDYTPAPQPTFLAYLTALEPGVLRWPAGHRSQEYIWASGGPGQSGDWTLTPALVDAFIALARSVKSDPLIGINVKRGTPAAAADLVRYLNVEKGYGVKYFQMGNEPDLTDGVTSGPDEYVTDVIAFTDAMKAVDPTIQFVGPELLTGAHVGGINGTVDWMTPILERVGPRFTGLSWHYYPLDSGQQNPSSSARISFEHMFQESAQDWPPAALGFAAEVMPRLDTLRAAHAPGAKVWITEIAEDPGPLAGLGISETIAAALWTADVYGRYGEYGPGAVVRWIYKTVSDHMYGLMTAADEPRPTYGAIWLYARHFGNRFVKAETTALTDVAAHAALRDDGALTVMLVNKTTTTKRVHVAAKGVCPVTSASDYTLTGTGLGATSFAINGEPLTAAAATGALAPRAVPAAEMWDVELPPTSARVVVYR